MRNEEGTKPLFSERNGAGTKALFSERNGEGTIRSFFVPFYQIFTTFGHEKWEKYCFKTPSIFLLFIQWIKAVMTLLSKWKTSVSLLVLLVFLEFTIFKKERKRNEEGTNVPFEK